jgi:hypothetical protein
MAWERPWEKFAATEQPIPYNQERTTTHTGTPDNLESAFDNRHPTTSNKHLLPTDTTDNQHRHPKTDTEQPIVIKKRKKMQQNRFE